MLTSLPAVTVNLAENGHPGYVVVSSRAGLAVGSVVSLASTAPLSQTDLKVQKLDGTRVYLWDPATQTPFDASAYLVSQTAQLTQAAQDVFGGLLRDFFVDPEELETPLATSELADILTAILPGGAGAASNVTVLNFPAQQHVVVDNIVSITQGTTQNTGTLTAAAQTVALPMSGRAGSAIGITGTWAGTIVFEASADAGTTWFGIEAYQPDITREVVAGATTANGVFQPLSLAGLTHVRVRASAWSSGTANIYMSATGTQAERLAPNLREDGDGSATYGAMVAGLDGGGLTRFLKVAADGGIILDQAAFTDGSHVTQVSNFPATQPVSVAALPLPAGASTSANQTNGSQQTQVVQGGNTLVVDASGRITVNVNGTVPISGNVGILGTVPVSGTFWQATQPISAAALPLPAGAATDASLTGGSQLTGLVGWTRVDTNNSTDVPLGAGASFNAAGAFTDMLGFTSIVGSVEVDQVGTFFIDESTDGINFKTTTIPIAAAQLNQQLTMGHTIDARYYRFRYINGATPQSVFRLHVMQTKNGVSGDQNSVGLPVYPNQKAQLVKAVLSGATPPSESSGPGYKEVEVDSHGSLMVTQAGMHGAFGGALSVNEMAVATFKANYGINTRAATQSVVATGTVTWANSQAFIATGAAANGAARLSTREAVRYVPGQGSIARFAPVFGTQATNSRQAVGFLTDTDGFGFGYNGTSFGILIRNNSVDTWVPQASWNGDDKFDGTGPSGVTLNPQNGSPMAIQMQWLGFGAVRWFIEDPSSGDMVLVHILKFGNSSPTPSIRQPDLPVRFEVVNTGNTSNIVGMVSSMGGYREGDSHVRGADVRFAFTNAKAGMDTAGTELWALRNKATNIYGGTNINNISVHVDKISLRNSSAGDAFVQLFLNPTLTTATFLDRRTATSVCETDVAGTWSSAFPASGELVANFCLAGGTTTDVLLGDLDIRLAPGDTLVVVAFAETTNVSVRCGMSWHEET